MSDSTVTSLNNGTIVKFPNSIKYTITKTAHPIIQNPSSLLLLTVQYPQNGLPKSTKSNDQDSSLPNVNPHQTGLVERADTSPYSLLHLSQPVMKNVVYYGAAANTQSNIVNKPVSNCNPLLVLKNDGDVSPQDDITVSKESCSQSNMPNNFVVTPLPKSVVCTVMPKDGKETKHNSKVEVVPQNCVASESGFELAKLEDWEDSSSEEDDEIQIIADKPVTCRAVASLPANFLYFGKVTSKSIIGGCKGVFAKIEIPRRAQFGPMEGILHGRSSEGILHEDHHLELTVENNGELERLDVSNENASNWMRYVRHAESASEQNLSLHQVRKNLYFIALRRIVPGEELKVWYSITYARARNLPVLALKNNSKRKINKCNTHLSGKENVSSKTSKDGDISKWRCSHCNKVFRSATPFNLHVLTHAADNLETKGVHNSIDISPYLDAGVYRERTKKPLVCFKCKKTFLSNSALACHIKSHASIKTFDCPICNEIFYKLLNLKNHIRSHSVGGNFFCPYCSKKFQEYRHVRNHIRRFHCEKNYGCLECSKRFSTLDKLRLHMLSHSDHREFSCATCGKQFKRKDKLSVHMKKLHISPKDQSETTETCKNDTNTSPQKDVNETDYSEYVYKCHMCMLGFKRRGMLVNHLANRHPDVTPESVPELNLPILKANRDYYCQYCEKIYKSSSKRKAHILKNHPGEKLPLSNRQISSKECTGNGSFSHTVGSVTTNPQNCDWCHKQYASKAKLLQHQRKKHINELPKSLQRPKKSTAILSLDDDADTIRDAIEKVIETDIFLPDALDMSEYETSAGDNKFFSGGEFIIDASTLKRAIKGEVLSADCSPETLSELGQIIDARPDGYFKVYQAPSGITLAHPVEVWDPFQLCLSPSETSPMLSTS